MFILRLLAPVLLALLAYWTLVRIQRRYALSRQQFYGLLIATAILLVVLIMIVMGRLPIQALAAPFVFLLTFALRNAHWLMQLLTLLRLRRPGGGSLGGASGGSGSGPGGRQSGTSTVATAWLSMQLAHSTGAMDGTVLRGQFKGQRLSALTLSELMVLAQACAEDADSLQVLEAYLDRMHPDWRDAFGGASEDTSHDAGAAGSGSAGVGSMTEALALEILGLAPGANREEIVAAHRRLMQKLHPDRGGTDYLAQQINEARDFLLGRVH